MNRKKLENGLRWLFHLWQLTWKYAASELRRKKSSSEGERYETKAVGNGSSYCSYLFYILMKSEKWRTCVFWRYIRFRASFFRFHQNKNKMEQQLETFSAIFVSCFSPSNEFNFFGISANVAYFQVHAGYKIIISDHSR